MTNQYEGSTAELCGITNWHFRVRAGTCDRWGGSNNIGSRMPMGVGSASSWSKCWDLLRLNRRERKDL